MDNEKPVEILHNMCVFVFRCAHMSMCKVSCHPVWSLKSQFICIRVCGCECMCSSWYSVTECAVCDLLSCVCCFAGLSVFASRMLICLIYWELIGIDFSCVSVCWNVNSWMWAIHTVILPLSPWCVFAHGLTECVCVLCHSMCLSVWGRPSE